ncbi:MAG: S8 family serine peptidase [Caldilineaceae bacterium]
MNVPAAWQIAHGSPATVVAVIDSGVDIAHEDLPPSAIWSNPLETAGEAGVDDDGNAATWTISTGWDWGRRGWTPQDDYGHGTHVAGHHRRSHGQRRGRERRRSHGLAVMPLRACWTIWARAVSMSSTRWRTPGVGYAHCEPEPGHPRRHAAGAPSTLWCWAHDQDMLVVAAAGNMRGRLCGLRRTLRRWLWPPPRKMTPLPRLTCLDAHVDLLRWA